LDEGLGVEELIVRLKNNLRSQGKKTLEDSGEMLRSLVLGYKMYFERL